MKKITFPEVGNIFPNMAYPDDKTYKSYYEKHGFVQIQEISETKELDVIYNIFRNYYNNEIFCVEKPHKESKEGLSTGFKFFRIPIIIDEQVISQYIENVNFTLMYFEEQAAILKKYFTSIIGNRKLVRVGLLFYEESNYISIHNDAHMGSRINFQFPLSYDTIGCIRVLKDGLMKPYLDELGSLNILGPQVWHDVPPIIKMTAPPLRVNLTLQFI